MLRTVDKLVFSMVIVQVHNYYGGTLYRHKEILRNLIQNSNCSRALTNPTRTSWKADVIAFPVTHMEVREPTLLGCPGLVHSSPAFKQLLVGGRGSWES
jgi:hypothetical protein